ncbi:HEAT repeat domain-containing protein [Kitasatospora sp. NPDC057542]|uniref:HEAT repeat domain-containing protein n=1 Tax=Streptomycetaceae TaxID=2062 RepID=UPI001CCFE9D1|nr:HEAT repeat domain-containing protein [Streptomyces sp. LS1784]
MDLPSLLAAIERGDDTTVFEFLEDAANDELTGDDGITLLAAAAHAGRHEVVDRLVVWDVDPTRPWAGGVDPVTWAAENGAYWVLNALLSPDRDPLRTDSPHRRALRVARAALESGAGAGSVPPPAHRAVITDLEAKLGVHRTPDELMARALVHADPEHDDWFASLFRIAEPESQERFDWARAVAEGAGDAGSLDRRRFALDAINFLGFGFNPDNGNDEPPFTLEAAEFLRPRLHTEQDPHALRTVVAAFTGYCTREELPAVLTHADHPDPGVRHRVTLAFPTLLTDHPDALAVLLRLAGDPAPVTRTSALHALTRHPVDTPVLRGVLTARLTDPHFDVRLEAAAALALRGDQRATPVLHEIRRGIKNRSSRGAGRLDDLHHQLRARTPGR